MLHYVRGDGGQIVVPKEELVRWITHKRRCVDVRSDEVGLHADACKKVCTELLAELEAMGK